MEQRIKDPTHTERRSENLMGSEASQSQWQIVLAEDNPADVGLVRYALHEHAIDCDLRVIVDGEEALSFITGLDLDSRLRCPDLLLLDLHLPKRDGNEILKRLRTSERCSRTPVVVLTSFDANIGLQDADKNAPIHYFPKSPSLEQFLRLGHIIKEVIGRSTSC